MVYGIIFIYLIIKLRYNMPYQNNKHNYVQIMFFLQVEYTKVIYLTLKYPW